MKIQVCVEDKPLTLNSGVLTLNDEQARRRGRKLKPLKDGRYEIVRQVMFKVGESFEYEGTGLPKGYMKPAPSEQAGTPQKTGGPAGDASSPQASGSDDEPDMDDDGMNQDPGTPEHPLANVNMSRMNRQQLVQLAMQMNLEVADGMTKAQIMDMIEAAAGEEV